MARKVKEYGKALVIVQVVGGKVIRAFVYNEDCKTRRGWENHAKKQASFMSCQTRATVVKKSPNEVCEDLRMRKVAVTMMGNQKDCADDYFSFDGRVPNEDDMRKYNFIPTVSRSSIPDFMTA